MEGHLKLRLTVCFNTSFIYQIKIFIKLALIKQKTFSYLFLKEAYFFAFNVLLNIYHLCRIYRFIWYINDAGTDAVKEAPSLQGAFKKDLLWTDARYDLNVLKIASLILKGLICIPVSRDVWYILVSLYLGMSGIFLYLCILGCLVYSRISVSRDVWYILVALYLEMSGKILVSLYLGIYILNMARSGNLLLGNLIKNKYRVTVENVPSLQC